MFTGIIEEMGKIKSIENYEKGMKLTVTANKVLESVKIGDSISTNGVCLTVSKINSTSFTADVMAETIRRSGFENLVVGEKVNLERALKSDGRFGGHIVTGHIDGTGIVTKFEKEDNAVWLTIKASNNILDYIVEKGSIAIDGVSLTVAYVDKEIFKVSIIPHTGKETILLNSKHMKIVNLECDIIGKYVAKLMGIKTSQQEENKDTINLDFLSRNGFL